MQESLKKALLELDYLEIMPDRNELILEKVGGISSSIHNEDGTNEEHDVITIVRFKRIINGFPVKGASRILVYLGENGQLEGIIYRWPRVVKTSISTKELKTALELQHGIDSKLKHFEAEVDSVAIASSELVLYDDGNGLIEPAIYVQGTLKSKTGFSASIGKYEPL